MAAVFFGVLLLVLALVFMLIYVAARYKVSSQTRIGAIFDLRLRSPASPRYPTKGAGETTPQPASTNGPVPAAVSKLREFRLARRITLRDLAKVLNVKAAFISRVEAGLEEFSADQLALIIREYALTKGEAKKLRKDLRRSARKK
jgi:hypothetical protein